MKRPKPSPFHRQLTLMLTVAALTACVGQIQSVSQPGQTVDVQTISPLTTPTIIPGIVEPTLDPLQLTLTAEPPSIPPTPWPADFTPQPGPTSTITPIPVVINMAEGLPDIEIYVFFVSRANGAYEKYLVPIAPLNASTNFFETVTKMLNLGVGDVIVNNYGLGPSLPKGIPQQTPS